MHTGLTMSSSPAVEPSSPSTTTPSSPALRGPECQFHTSTPNIVLKKQQPPLNVSLPATAPSTPPIYGEPALTPPPRSPGSIAAPSASGDGRNHPPDGTSSDKSSEAAAGSISRPASTALSRKESYKAQRQHYRREKKRAASALLHSIEDPSVIVLADWLKIRGSLKSWTKLWCVLKPGLLLLYKSPKAKSSHWVGTVLLTSCQVIERPSKKDGFCFKLYHPLEQSIWAPRGPHNEAIGAVVQPLPTAHLIFRAPSQAAGHCWLDGLELALRCSNAMLRCSRSRPDHTIASTVAPTSLSHEELEKHFNDHVEKLAKYFTSTSPTPLMYVSDYSPQKIKSKFAQKPRKLSKWAQFIESLEFVSKEHDSTDSQTPESDRREAGFLDFLWKRETERIFESKSATDTPNRRSPMFSCFDRAKVTPPSGEKRLERPPKEDSFNTEAMRRSSSPVTDTSKYEETIKSEAKTDTESEDRIKSKMDRKESLLRSDFVREDSEVVITRTAPSLERFMNFDTSSSEDIDEDDASICSGKSNFVKSDKYTLINHKKLPSNNFEMVTSKRRDERFSTQDVYVAGKIVRSELAGSESDSDSEVSHVGMPDKGEDIDRKKKEILARINSLWVEDPDREIGVAGELVEEVAEENKSLLWFLLKQVRPGMDLSKVVLPTFILEPRSFLDKLSDSYYHADILSQAQSIEDPYLRFKCVLRWYLSGLYRKPKGLKKPYNPVLGENFRCCWKHPNSDTYTYYVAEQVSHHPPVSAFYVSNRKDGFVIQGSLLARSKFYGNSTSAILEGCAKVHLLNWGETYITTAPYAHCKGIVIGTLSMELGGKVHVLCQETGYHADVEFKLRSFLGGSDQTNAISGRIKRGKDTVATVDGYWDGRIDIRDKKTGEESNLLDVAVLREQRLVRYLMRLDKQTEFESQRLWAKVSQAILNDDQVAATEQKTVIEEAQRNRARGLLTDWIPAHFKRDLQPLHLEGIVDQAWQYSHMNISPWQPEEQLEYEEQFVIKSVRCDEAATRRSDASPRLTQRPSDTDSREDVSRRAKASSRTLKQSLHGIERTLRDQAIAIEKLSKAVEAVGESQRAAAFRLHNVARMPTTSHAWDLLLGFVMAMVLQALLNCVFYKRD